MGNSAVATERDLTTLRIELVASAQFACMLSIGHCVAFVIAAAMSPDAPWFVAVCAVVLLSWAWTLRRYALLRDRRSYIALELSGETDCSIQMRNGRWVRGQVKASTYALPWLIVLHLAVVGRTFGLHVVLFPDSMVRDAHRRLRVRLRWANYDTARGEPTDAPL